MTTRERALAGYHNRCAWGHAHPGPFQFDHVNREGTAHRKTIGRNIEHWLCQEFEREGRWPRDIQLLCRHCHQIKTTNDAKGFDRHHVYRPTYHQWLSNQKGDV